MGTHRTYKVTLTGLSPLLMHADNIDAEERAKEWSRQNKKKSVAGDDRSPAWKWIGYGYYEDNMFAIPSDNIMTAIREGGTQVGVPGQGKKTFKAQTQSGLCVCEFAWPIHINGKPVSTDFLNDLLEEEDFSKHMDSVKKNRFMLFVKRARVGQSKHVRVRPRFDHWSISGTIDVWDDQITTSILEEILKVAGEMKGLCDWRPSSKTPGPYGRFRAEVEEL